MTDPRVLAFFQEEIDAGTAPAAAKAKALSRMAALDAIGAGDGEQDLGAPVPFRSDYLATPPEVRASRGETVGKPEAAVRGVAKGVTLRNADEIAGYVGAEGSSPATRGYMIARGIPEGDSSRFEETRRAARDKYRAADQAAEEDQPWTSMGAELVGAGVVAPAFGGASTAGKAMLTGGKMGVPYAVGASKREIADEPGAVALEGVGGGILGGISGLLGYAGARVLGGTGNKIADFMNDRLDGVPRGTSAAEAALRGEVIPLPSASARAAKETGEAIAERANAPSALGPNLTVRQAFDQTQDLKKRLAKFAEEPIDDLFDVAQATGSRSAALRQLRLRQMPDTMDQAQAKYAKSLDTGARILDNMVEHVSANPTAIGRGNTSKGIATALKQNIKDIHTLGSERSRPYYTAYENTAGGVDVGKVINFYRDELAKREGLNDSFTSGLRSQLADLEKRGAGGGLSVIEANNKRVLANEVINGQSSMFDGVDMDVQGGFAKRLRYVIDEVFDDAEKVGPADAVKYLRKGNAIWAATQKAAEERKTATVMRIISATAKDPGSTEMLPRQMLTMGEEQVTGIFRLLHETDPGMARQAFGQMLEEAFTQVGKPARNAVKTREVGGTRLAPARAFGPNGVLTKSEAALQAAAKGLPGGAEAIDLSFKMLKRLSFGPGLEGSQTASLAADVITEKAPDALLALANISGIGKPARALLGVLGNMTGDNKALADALVTPQGISATNRALMLALRAQQGIKITDVAAREAMAALTSAGIVGYDRATKPKPGRDPRLGEPAPPIERLQDMPIAQQEISP